MTVTEKTLARHTPYDDAYGSCERTYAELRIYSGSMDPDAISGRLGITPTSVQRKGERKTNSLGRSREVPLNGWFFSSEGKTASRDLRRHLDWILDRVEPTKDQLAEIQSRVGVTMLINCVWWSAMGMGGPTLWPEQMRRIANLNLECSFELAFFGTDSDQ